MPWLTLVNFYTRCCPDECQGMLVTRTTVQGRNIGNGQSTRRHRNLLPVAFNHQHIRNPRDQSRVFSKLFFYVSKNQK